MSDCGHASPRCAAHGGGTSSSSSSSSQGVGALHALDARPRRRRGVPALALADSPVATSPTRVMVNPADYPAPARASPGTLRLAPSTPCPAAAAAIPCTPRSAAAAIAALTAAANAAAPPPPPTPSTSPTPRPPPLQLPLPPSPVTAPSPTRGSLGAGTPVPGILSPVFSARGAGEWGFCGQDEVQGEDEEIEDEDEEEEEEEQPVFAVNGPRDVLTATVFEQARKDTFYLLAVDFFPRWAAAVDSQLAAWASNSSSSNNAAAAAALRSHVPRTLAGVLARRAWTESFAVFLRQQLAVENLRFYLAATEFRHTDFAGREMLELEAQRLFARFIAPGAPEQINTSAEISSALCRLLFCQSLDDYARTHADAPTSVTSTTTSTARSCRSSPSSPATLAAPLPPARTGIPRVQSCTHGFPAEPEPPPAPTPARKRLGFLRSLSHLSFGRRKEAASPTSSSSSTGDGSTADLPPAPCTDDTLSALQRNHFRSSCNLMQYQHQLGASSGSRPAGDAARPLARTQSASTGMALLAGTGTVRTTPSSPRGSTSAVPGDDLSPSSLPCSLATSLRGAGPCSGTNAGTNTTAFRPDVPSPLVVEIAPQTGDAPGTVLLTPRRSAPALPLAPGLPGPLPGQDAAISPCRRHRAKTRSKKHGRRHGEDGEGAVPDDDRPARAAAPSSAVASVLLRKRAFTNGSGKAATSTGTPTPTTATTTSSASVSCSGSETPSEIIISVGSSRSEDDEEPVRLSSIAYLSR